MERLDSATLSIVVQVVREEDVDRIVAEEGEDQVVGSAEIVPDTVVS